MMAGWVVRLDRGKKLGRQRFGVSIEKSMNQVGGKISPRPRAFS